MASLIEGIVSLEDDDDFVNILVYGRSGAGKTVFAGSDDRVLYLAPEDDGTISAKRQGSKADKRPIGSWDDMATALEQLAEVEDKITEYYDWICIDSVTHMQQIMLRHILDTVVEENETRDPDIPAIADHQKWQNMFKRFVLFINALPVNVCWTGLVKNEEDEDGNEFLTVDIQGKGYQMAQTIASYMTSYGYMEVKEVKLKKDGEFLKDADGEIRTKTTRTITWKDTGKIQGKDRTDVLAPRTKDYTLKDIRELVDGSKTREEIEAAKRPKRSATKAAPKKAAADVPAKRTTVKKTAEEVENSVPDNEKVSV